jgi:ribosomal protein S18 acetylase RimI-like enzyme
VPVPIRDARPADAAPIALVHVRAWQVAYRGIMPDAYLDGLTPDDRLAGWRRTLQSSPSGERVLVADDRGAITGFVAVGPAEGEPCGELLVLNVAPTRWRRGLGRRLLRAGERALAALGHREAILWVVKENDRARRFYEAHGWRAEEAERRCTFGGVVVPDVRYRRRLPAGPGSASATGQHDDDEAEGHHGGELQPAGDERQRIGVEQPEEVGQGHRGDGGQDALDVAAGRLLPRPLDVDEHGGHLVVGGGRVVELGT